MPEPLTFHIYDHPGFYTVDNQWFSDGWVFKDGEVFAVSVDRKDQHDAVLGRMSPTDFLASDAPDAAKAWLRRLLNGPST